MQSSQHSHNSGHQKRLVTSIFRALVLKVTRLVFIWGVICATCSKLNLYQGYRYSCHSNGLCLVSIQSLLQQTLLQTPSAGADDLSEGGGAEEAEADGHSSGNGHAS